MADPEAQAWAQIGTNIAKENQPATSEPATSSVPPASAEADATKAAERDEDANSEVQLHVDEDAEPFQVDDAIENEPEPETDGQEGTATSPKEDGDSQTQESEDSKEKDSDHKDDKDRRRRSKDGDDDESDIPQKTNSGNPKMVRARVFVGHLNTEKASKKDVEDLFGPYGKVIGVSLQHGYGFVQYESEEEAKKAIRELHGTHFCGMRMVVDKPVALKKLLGEDPRSPAPWPSSGSHGERARRDRQYFDELDYYRRRELYDRYAHLEELERYYYSRLQAPPVPPPRRDPYFDRYADRYPPHPQAAAMPQQGLSPGPDRYMDRYAERYRQFEFEESRPRDRRYPPAGGPAYDRPRDDPFDRKPMYERTAERYGPPRRPM